MEGEGRSERRASTRNEGNDQRQPRKSRKGVWVGEEQGKRKDIGQGMRVGTGTGTESGKPSEQDEGGQGDRGNGTGSQPRPAQRMRMRGWGAK